MPALPPALETLLDIAAGLVRRSPSGRVALARLEPVVDPATLPAPVRERVAAELAAARAAATPPLAPKDVEGILRSAWRRPAAKVLDRLDPQPAAVTPAAQVHRAELDGRAVAVKVRRPGLAAQVRADLAVLDAVAAPLASLLRAADVRALLREVRETALDELDLEHEGSGQRQAARLLRRVEGVEVPRTHGEHCTEDVLVSDWLDGPTLAEAAPEDPAGVARALVRAHTAALRGGLALTDPRPGHVVLRPGGAIGLLGTGLARRVDRARAAAALEAAGALRRGDDAAFAAAVAGDLGLLPDPDPALARATLGPLAGGPMALDAASLAATAERALDRVEDWVAVAARARLRPEDLAAGRSAGQLALLLARLGATEDWLELATA